MMFFLESELLNLPGYDAICLRNLQLIHTWQLHINEQPL